MSQPQQGIEVNDLLSRIQALRLKHELGTQIIPAPKTTNNWPLDYSHVYLWRQQQLARLTTDEQFLESAKKFYRANCAAFINHWCDTYDPRNKGLGLPDYMPFVMFERQDELVQFMVACLGNEVSGLVEKCRDMGATWGAIGVSVWLWLFWGGAVGWGSATADKVDQIGDANSIFEKIRIMIRRLPPVFQPIGFNDSKHLMHKRLLNAENGGSITGEIGHNIGRGGRTRMYVVDEAAHVERPEAIDAALSENTRVRIDISSVSGPGTVFHRTRQSGQEWEPGKTLARGMTNVFIMDWSHHPAKTKEWHAERKAFWKLKGMPHVFAREIERNYEASTENVVIPAEYVTAAIDAHVKLGFDDTGRATAGLDVADGGQDSNAIVGGKGSIVRIVQEWTERDPGITARRAVQAIRTGKDMLPCALQYDCIGVGSGVKTETNRLKDDGLLPAGLTIVAWNAGGKILKPFERLIPGDEQSPLNKDFYGNFKAQAWWQVGLRFYRTFLAITEGVHFEPEELISLDSKAIGQVQLLKLQQELSQATKGYSTRMQVIINKTPDGTKSPNHADALIMAYWPMPGQYVLSASAFATPILVTGV